MELSGQVAIVTGAGRGIGRATAPERNSGARHPGPSPISSRNARRPRCTPPSSRDQAARLFGFAFGAGLGAGFGAGFGFGL